MAPSRRMRSAGAPLPPPARQGKIAPCAAMALCGVASGFEVTPAAAAAAAAHRSLLPGCSSASASPFASTQLSRARRCVARLAACACRRRVCQQHTGCYLLCRAASAAACCTRSILRCRVLSELPYVAIRTLAAVERTAVPAVCRVGSNAGCLGCRVLGMHVHEPAVACCAACSAVQQAWLCGGQAACVLWCAVLGCAC
jgi:hypothetical protein